MTRFTGTASFFGRALADSPISSIPAARGCAQGDAALRPAGRACQASGRGRQHDAHGRRRVETTAAPTGVAAPLTTVGLRPPPSAAANLPRSEGGQAPRHSHPDCRAAALGAYSRRSRWQPWHFPAYGALLC